MSTTQSSSTAFEVPVIDISPYTGNGTAEDRARVADEMDRACSTVGFVPVSYTHLTLPTIYSV